MVNKITTPLMPMSGVKRGLDNQLMTPQSMKKLQFDSEKPFSSTVIMDRTRNLFPEHAGVLCIVSSQTTCACFLATYHRLVDIHIIECSAMQVCKALRVLHFGGRTDLKSTCRRGTRITAEWIGQTRQARLGIPLELGRR